MEGSRYPDGTRVPNNVYPYAAKMGITGSPRPDQPSTRRSPSPPPSMRPSSPPKIMSSRTAAAGVAGLRPKAATPKQATSPSSRRANGKPPASILTNVGSLERQSIFTTTVPPKAPSPEPEADEDTSKPKQTWGFWGYAAARSEEVDEEGAPVAASPPPRIGSRKGNPIWAGLTWAFNPSVKRGNGQ